MEIQYHNSIPYTIIDGIRRYGETTPVNEQEIAHFHRTQASYIHIIRHMRGLSKEAEQLALTYTIQDGDETKPITKELLQDLLSTAGSKFHEHINDPLTIISFAEEHIQEKVKKREKLLWQKTPRGDYVCRLVSYITGQEKEFFNLKPSEPLGTCHVVEISEDIKPEITKEIRGKGEKIDEIPVNVIRGVPPQSNTLIIILKKPDITAPATIFTAYTGIIAPPLPYHTQTEEEFDYNKEWWEKHTFIIEPENNL